MDDLDRRASDTASNPDTIFEKCDRVLHRGTVAGQLDIRRVDVEAGSGFLERSTDTVTGTVDQSVEDCGRDDKNVNRYGWTGTSFFDQSWYDECIGFDKEFDKILVKVAPLLGLDLDALPIKRKR